jgi:hypothetical protein
MANVLLPKVTLCSECKQRFEEYRAFIASGKISEQEALRNAVRECDTEDYRFFYPFGFSKHGVVFVAMEEVDFQKGMRLSRKARTGK